MKAAWYEGRGPAGEVLTVGEIDAPEPGPGQLRVRVALSGINPGDVKKRSDWLGDRMPFPRDPAQRGPPTAPTGARSRPASRRPSSRRAPARSSRRALQSR